MKKGIYYQADDGGGSGGGSAPTGIVLDIDGEEKTFTPEQVLDMHKNLASATQNSQKAAPLLKLAEQVGLDPDDLSQQIPGAFSLIQDLVDQGIIDQEGNVIKQKAAPANADDDSDDNDNSNSSSEQISASKIAELIEAKLEEKLNPFQKAIQDLGNVNTGLQRAEISRRLKAEYQDADLSDEDVTTIMSMSRASRGKANLRQAAEQFIGKRQEQLTKMEQQIVEKYKKAGVDLSQFDLNSLKEQDADSVAARITQDKRLSFRKGDKTISPAQAAKDYLDMTL